MHPHLTPQELYEKLKLQPNPTLLDVRSEKEFSEWHIYQSNNIPFSRLRRNLKSLPQKGEIITICNRGNDSRYATELLNKKGYTAYTLREGLRGWNGIYDIVEVESEDANKYQVFQVKRLGKGCLAYILVIPKSGWAIIIDPSQHIDEYTDFLKERKLKLKGVLDTHVHADHFSGSYRLSHKFSVPHLLPEKSEVSFQFSSLEKILPKLLPSINIKILETPGHTPESVAIVLDTSFVFTGDTLLIDKVGRSDLGEKKEESAREIYHSIMDTLFSLPDEVYVLPTHTSQLLVPGQLVTASLRYAKKFNVIHEYDSEEAFIAAQKESASPPPNYKTIKEMNRKGKMSSKIDLDELELGANVCAADLGS